MSSSMHGLVDEPPPTKKQPRELLCPQCLDSLPNLTVVHDPERRLMPCMRWVG